MVGASLDSQVRVRIMGGVGTASPIDRKIDRLISGDFKVAADLGENLTEITVMTRGGNLSRVKVDAQCTFATGQLSVFSNLRASKPGS